MIKRGRPRGTTNAELGKVSRTKKRKSTEDEELVCICPYEVDEKVLCYEPDPSKCKVLYEAKVLNIMSTKDQTGRKLFEYLIHFQGWNSSWDRYVADDLIMKDTEENRQLQFDLKEAADINQRKGKKKKGKRQQESQTGDVTVGRKIGNYGNQFMQMDEAVDGSEGGDEEEEEYNVQVVIPDEVRKILDVDWIFINEENKLPILPSRINVVHILEKFVKSSALRKLQLWYKKYQWELIALRVTNNSIGTQSLVTYPPSKGPVAQVAEGKLPDELVRILHDVGIMKQLATDMQVMFDVYLDKILFYSPERERHLKALQQIPFNIPPWTIVMPEVLIFTEEELKTTRNETKSCPEALTSSHESNEPSTSSSSGYSSRCIDKETKNGGSVMGTKPEEFTAEVLCRRRIAEFVKELMDWKLKTEVFSRPSLVYGLPHLLRLMVKLPQLFFRIDLPKSKFGQLAAYINRLLCFIIREFDEDDMLYEAAEYDSRSKFQALRSP